MMFEKCTYHVMRNGGFVDAVEGYRFEVAGHELYVRNERKAGWAVTDPETGMLVNGGYGTRRQAVEGAEKLLPKLDEVRATPKYEDMRRKFAEYVGKMPRLDPERLAANRKLKEEHGDAVRVEMTDADGTTYEVTDSGLVKVTDSNGEEVAASVEPKTVEVREDKPEPPREDIEIIDTATTSALEMLRQFAEGKNLAVTQKNERSLIWVVGDTKAYKDELKEMGLRYSKKKEGWWLKVA